MRRQLADEIISAVTRREPDACISVIGLSGTHHIKLSCRLGERTMTFTVPSTARSTRRRVLNYARKIRTMLREEES